MNQDQIWHLLSKKLSGEATRDELIQLEELLRSDPDMHYALQNVSDIWQLPARLPAEPEIEDVFHRHEERMKAVGIYLQEDSGGKQESLFLKRRKKLIVVSFVLAIIPISLLYYYPIHRLPFFASQSEKQLQSTDRNEISVRNGSTTKISLPDGSQVWLNAGSSLTYSKNFNNGTREVELKGEAFFDVIKNAQQPFIIHTGTIDVKVLGTQFNVRSYPTDKTSETSLVRGSVEVTVRKRPDEKYVLKPNEKLVVLNDASTLKPAGIAYKADNKESIIAIKKLTYRKGDSLAIETAWTNNKLLFEDETFEEVAKKIERWYDVEIEFRNKDLKDITLRGSFTNESLQQAMEALQFIARFKYEIRNKKVIVY